MQVIAVGHSIVYGNWDPEGGWVQRLRKHLDKRALEEQDEELVSEVLNLGIPGEDSGDLRERVRKEVERRLWEEVETVAFVMTGANDIQLLVQENRVRVGKEQFRDNLESIVDDLQQLADHVVLVTECYTTVDGEIPYAPEKAINDERLGEYVEIQRELASEKGIEIIDLRTLRSKEEWASMLEDGIHPDQDGHELIYGEAIDAIEELELL
ncbi:MAG: SGNH/GDSL hydrolase family protein [Candidatus Nanohaloarchaea archaeon]